MLPRTASTMQPGTPQNPHLVANPVVTTQIPTMAVPQGMMLVHPEPVPLTPPPPNLQMARPSRPWRMYGRIVGLVILLFLFEIFLFDGMMMAIYGEPLYGACLLYTSPSPRD